MTLPTDAKARKGIPIYSGCIKYFPDALAAVAEVSCIGNAQHHPDEPLHWDKSASTDELDALMRHLIDTQTDDRDADGVLHAAKVAWRALANLQRLADEGVNVLQEEPIRAGFYSHHEGGPLVRDDPADGHVWPSGWTLMEETGSTRTEYQTCLACRAKRERRGEWLSNIGRWWYGRPDEAGQCSAA